MSFASLSAIKIIWFLMIKIVLGDGELEAKFCIEVHGRLS